MNKFYKNEIRNNLMIEWYDDYERILNDDVFKMSNCNQISYTMFFPMMVSIF